MNAKHLRLLRQVLVDTAATHETLPMGHWAASDEEQPCGTAACAAGTLALDPRGRAAGLMIMTAVTHEDVADAKAVRDVGVALLTVAYGGATSWVALRRFFDLPQAKIGWLFDPHQYAEAGIAPRRVPIADVIKRVDELLA